MESLAHLRDVLVHKPRRVRDPDKAQKIPAQQTMVLTYFEGNPTVRRDICHQLVCAIWDWNPRPPLWAMQIPGHRNDRMYDHLYTRVYDGEEDQLQYYLDLDQALPSIMIKCKLPFIKTIEELIRREHGQKAKGS